MSEQNKKPIIGISLGDINSIAPEVVIKSLSDHRINEYCVPVVYGSPRVISYWKKLLEMPDFNLHITKGVDQLNYKRSNIIVCWEEEVEIKPGQSLPQGGAYAFKSLEAATNDLKAGKINALVTAPLNKHNVNTEALPFSGHTEYLAAQANTSEYLMELVDEDFRVGLVTGHLPVKDVASKLSIDLLIKKIQLMHNSLKSDFGITKPRIGVLGLNPHAGENGLLGKEELEIIAPAVNKAQHEMNMLAFGPFPADGFFGSGQFRKFDGILAMYHDQGLIPFKYMAFESGVNYTAGLPFIRTSPDHGTAYNIAGKNQASELSMRNAIYLAIDIYNRRSLNAELSAQPLAFTPLKRERFRIDF